MKTQITELFGLTVYTDRAVYVGEVEDVVIDIDSKKIDCLAVGNLSPEIGDLKGYKGMKIPYRLIKSIGDIVIIRHLQNTFKSVKEEK